MSLRSHDNVLLYMFIVNWIKSKHRIFFQILLFYSFKQEKKGAITRPVSDNIVRYQIQDIWLEYAQIIHLNLSYANFSSSIDKTFTIWKWGYCAWGADRIDSWNWEWMGMHQINEQQRCMQDYLLQAGAEASWITVFDTRMIICKNLYHAPDSKNL